MYRFVLSAKQTASGRLDVYWAGVGVGHGLYEAAMYPTAKAADAVREMIPPPYSPYEWTVVRIYATDEKIVRAPNWEVKDPSSLDHTDLENIVTGIQTYLFENEDEERFEGDKWDPDKAVCGSDFIQYASELLQYYGLAPYTPEEEEQCQKLSTD